jgi:probable F420-dependent oxidoreductase
MTTDTFVADSQSRAGGRARTEFGLCVPVRNEQLTETMQLIERLGFDYLACGEHVMFDAPSLNSIVTLSYAAAVTSRIGLLSSVTLAPLYPAALLAKLAAALDLASGGRFTLGVGVGGEYPAEFDGCGVPLSERGQRADEAIHVLRALWSGGRTDFRGRFVSFSGGQIKPSPTRSRLPIWVSGRSDAAMRRAARVGDGWMPYLYTPEMLASGVMKLAGFAAEEGRQAPEIRPVVCCFITVDETGSRARRTASEMVSGLYGQDFTGRAARYLIAGTAEECQRRVTEYVEAGASAVIFMPACPSDDHAVMSQRIAEQVLPAIPAGLAS